MCGSRSGSVSQPRASSFFLEGLRVNGKRRWWWLPQPNAISHCNGDANGHGNPDCNRYANCYGYGHGYHYTNA